MDRSVSGTGGERRGVEEQPVAARQPDDAPLVESDCLGSGAHQGQLFQGTVSSIDSAVGGTQGGVGHRPPNRAIDLEGPARESTLYRTGSASDGRFGDEAAGGEAHPADAEARLYDRGETRCSGHQLTNPEADVFESAAGWQTASCSTQKPTRTRKIWS